MILIRSILEKHDEFNQELFDQLFTTNTYEIGGDRLPVLFHTEIVRMMKSLKHDFPSIITLSSIGNTFQNREIDLMTVDARHHLTTGSS